MRLLHLLHLAQMFRKRDQRFSQRCSGKFKYSETRCRRAKKGVETTATGHLDTGFSRFPCVYKQTLRRFPTFQVATTCFSCSPPDLNLWVTDCSCLVCIVVSCLVCTVVVVLCVLLSSYVYLLYYLCIAVFTLDAGLLARSQYSEGPATGHLDTGFSWFPCVYKQMLRWFPTFQVATTCFSCSPPDLNLAVTNFMFCIHVK